MYKICNFCAVSAFRLQGQKLIVLTWITMDKFCASIFNLLILCTTWSRKFANKVNSMWLIEFRMWKWKCRREVVSLKFCGTRNVLILFHYIFWTLPQRWRCPTLISHSPQNFSLIWVDYTKNITSSYFGSKISKLYYDPWTL